MKEPITLPGQQGREGSSVRPDRLLTIGQVVVQLRVEFADLSITKVRYLEDRGLVSPVRTSGRYRKYSAADVRQLRTILTLQRDEYLPLDVIRQRVDRGTASLLGRSPASLDASVRTGVALKREESSYTVKEACEAAGVDEPFLSTLVEYRLIDRPVTGDALLSESAVEVARICHLLSRFGVEPRNLRLLSLSAEREASLLEQVTTPSLRSTHADKREYGETTLVELGALLSRLLHLLLYKELRKLL